MFKRFVISVFVISAGISMAKAASNDNGNTEVLGYKIGSSSCNDIRRSLSASHPELTEEKATDIPKNYKTYTSNSYGYGVVGLIKVSLICEDSDKSLLRGASLSFDNATAPTVTDIFNKKYTKLQEANGATIYKTPGGVLMTSPTTDGFKAFYSDMTLFQGLSDMANSMDSKL